MKNDPNRPPQRALVTIGALAMLTLSSLFYYSDQLFAPTYQTATPTPVPVVDMGDTTGLILFSLVIVIIILTGVFWPRHHSQKKSS
jgi:hypothetical protein